MKKGDLRRGQLLDMAEKLFFEQGYDRTSIQDILDALRLSKGGFYHYFDAKETVLREIVERDYGDSHRAVSPLRQAEDAIVLDTTDLDLEQSQLAAEKIVLDRLAELGM